MVRPAFELLVDPHAEIDITHPFQIGGFGLDLLGYRVQIFLVCQAELLYCSNFRRSLVI
jgi:hypothetical protein